jgi:hypothetical protein
MARLDPAFAARTFSSDEALCRTAVAQTAVDFDALLQQGFARIPVADAPFAEGGFATPSGKCEFDNPLLAQRGINTLPDYLPNYETPTAAYPLAMISPPARNFLNSSFANVASLRAWKSARCWSCTLTMPPRAALPTVMPCASSMPGASMSATPASTAAPVPAWWWGWACGGASTAPTARM